MKLVCLSDTHGQHRKIPVPDGDVLVYAGDITRAGEFSILGDFCSWLQDMPHKDKVVIFGNHDMFSDQASARSMIRDTGAKYLENSWCEIGGKKFWGSPYTPTFGTLGFMASEKELFHMWQNVPHDVDILVTHGPAYGILDFNGRENCGSKALLEILDTRPWIDLHIFGHIHESHGSLPGSVNCATKPIIVELP